MDDLIHVTDCLLTPSDKHTVYMLFHHLECWEPSQHLFIDTGKPRIACVEVVGSGPSGY